MGKNIADHLVETLEKAGVKRIYAVTGDSLNRVNEAVRKNGKIDWIHVRHEETGAYAAGAEAQLNGNLACCAGSCGPGHVHLINGLYDAHRSGAPVLAIASSISSFEFGMSYFQETNIYKLFTDCSYYTEVATTPRQLPRMLQTAMQTAISSRGVSVLGLPGDLTAQTIEADLSSVRPFVCNTNTSPCQEEINELAELLNKHEKVTLYCGSGAKDAHEEVVQLSQLLNAPVAYTFKSKLDIQYANPNEVGLTGLLGMPSGYDSMHEAEVLLLLGTDFPYESFIPQDNIIVQVDIDATRLGRRAKLDMGICGDVKTTLQSLLLYIEQKQDRHFLNRQLNNYEKTLNNLRETAASKGKDQSISPEFLMSEINFMADKDAIFTVDTGMTCVWGARYLQGTGERKMLGSFNHGSMANALPQAIGAALAYPGRQVLALCGDGGISMCLGELATIVQYKLPIKIVVFNNRALGMVKLEMEVDGIPDWQTDMYNPDFSRVALSMGMEGYNVMSPGAVTSTLEKILKTEGPALMNVMTDPNALAMPPKIQFDQMKGFTQSMYKLLIEGRTQEIMDTINSNIKHLKEVF